MVDPLNFNSLLTLLPTLLPPGTSSPLPVSTDVIAALVHTIHTALHFRLISPAYQVNEIHPHREPDSSSSGEDVDDNMSEATAVEQEDGSPPSVGRLAEDWNSRGELSYSFHYKHDQSAMDFRIRVGRMGNRVQIDAMAEDGAPHTLSVILTDIVEPGAFPIPSSATSSAAETGDGPDGLARAVGFKSVNDIKAFVEKYKREIISKLVPDLELAGYSESRGPDAHLPPMAPHQPDPNPPHPIINPLADIRSPYNPASIGHRDLDPLASMRPPGLFNPNADGGGMYMDFSHPLFDSRRRGIDPDVEGPGGTIQPPGARWDPVGPGMGPGGGRPYPGPAGNPLSGAGHGDRWGDELPPPGEFGPDLGRFGGNIGGPLGGGRGGRGGGSGGSRGGGSGGFGGGSMFM
ncbi:hypothetical protein L204_104042 [Cryptococcus depauperatus]|nr:hypothetical protein L204_03195 [Cryptococcus depauperatus CBS 7855]